MALRGHRSCTANQTGSFHLVYNSTCVVAAPIVPLVLEPSGGVRVSDVIVLAWSAKRWRTTQTEGELRFEWVPRVGYTFSGGTHFFVVVEWPPILDKLTLSGGWTSCGGVALLVPARHKATPKRIAVWICNVLWTYANGEPTRCRGKIDKATCLRFVYFLLFLLSFFSLSVFSSFLRGQHTMPYPISLEI